jgi:hypothetical protein
MSFRAPLLVCNLIKTIEKNSFRQSASSQHGIFKYGVYHRWRACHVDVIVAQITDDTQRGIANSTGLEIWRYVIEIQLEEPPKKAWSQAMFFPFIRNWLSR